MQEEAEEGRPKRDAARVTDFRRFHNTGARQGSQEDLHQEQEPGKVAAVVKRFETPDKAEQQQEATGTKRNKAKRNISGDLPDHPSASQASFSPSGPIAEAADMSEMEKLQQELQRQKEINEQMKRELEEARLRQEIQEEKMKQAEMARAKETLAKRQEQLEKRHEESLKELDTIMEGVKENPSV